MAKIFLVSPGRAYLVFAAEGSLITKKDGSPIAEIPEGANSLGLTVETNEIIVHDNNAQIQQLYNGNAGSRAIGDSSGSTNLSSFKVEIVSSLPATGELGVIYLLRTARTGADKYDEYIWANSEWEMLGRMPESGGSIDDSGYAKLGSVNTFTRDQNILGSLDVSNAIEADSLRATYLTSPNAELGTINASELSVLEFSAAGLTTSALTVLSPAANGAILSVYGSTADETDTVEIGDSSRSCQVNLNADVTVTRTLNVNGELVLAPSDSGIRFGTSEMTLSPSRLRTLRVEATSAMSTLDLSATNVKTDTLDVGTINISQVATLYMADVASETNRALVISSKVSVQDTLYAANVDAGTSLTVDQIAMGHNSAITISADGANGILHMSGAELEVNAVSAITRLKAPQLFADLAKITNMTVLTELNAPLARVTRMSVLTTLDASSVRASQMNVMGMLTTSTATVTRVSVLSELVVKDLVVTGTAAGLPESGGGGSVEIPDPLSVANLSANAASFGAVTVTNTLTVPEGVYFTPTLAFKESTLNAKQINLLNPENEFDDVTLGVHGVECTAMTVSNLRIMGDVHATKVWCLHLGSDHESQSNPIKLESPLLGETAFVRRSLRVGSIGAVADYNTASACIELSCGETSETDSLVRFGVDRFIVTQNPLKKSTAAALPMLVMDNEYVGRDANGKPEDYFNLYVCPNDMANNTNPSSAMLELTGRYLDSYGQISCQHKLLARLSVMEILAGADNSMNSSPLIRLVAPGRNTPANHTTLSIVGTLAHYTKGNGSGVSYYMDSEAAYYCDEYKGSKNDPSLYINPTAQEASNVRALYSYHTNLASIPAGKSTLIPGLYSLNMLCAASLTAGTGGAGTLGLSQFGVNVWGAYIQKPLRALDSTSDIKGLYYRPTTTILPNLWQELVTSDGRPLSSVSEYTLDETAFGLLSNTAQHPVSTDSFPSTVNNSSAWERDEGRYNICVTSIEFGFSTGASGLTLTWPSNVIWPDEPDRLPPTQFQPNMCYRFVARMEPIPEPNSYMFTDAAITYKWVILVSQTYSYPNPWSVT